MTQQMLLLFMMTLSVPQAIGADTEDAQTNNVLCGTLRKHIKTPLEHPDAPDCKLQGDPSGGEPGLG